MNYIRKNFNRARKSLLSSSLTTNILMLVVIIFLFNLNINAFLADAQQADTVVGEGHTGYIVKWMVGIVAPTAPTITGPASGYPGTNYTYTFNATDPTGYQIRYGVDWKFANGNTYTSSDTMDGTADIWLPASPGYVNSGTAQNTSLSWTSTGTKKFQALTQNSQGVNSVWSSSYLVTINDAPVDGVCGTRNTTYPAGTTGYPGGSTYCSAGTESASPAFPSPGTSVTWTCNALYGGSPSPVCTATLIQTTYTINTTVASAGGTIESTSDNVINCSGSCNYTYNDGSPITLQAIPASSYWEFSGWGGACSGTAPTCVITANGNQNVTASFELRKFDYREF